MSNAGFTHFLSIQNVRKHLTKFGQGKETSQKEEKLQKDEWDEWRFWTWAAGPIPHPNSQPKIGCSQNHFPSQFSPPFPRLFVQSPKLQWGGGCAILILGDSA
jgi:hypothetical protein